MVIRTGDILSPALQFPDAVVDVRRVRIALLVYGLFLLVVELVGSRLALVGWGQVTVLDIASAVADASLVVAVVLAVLLSGKLAVRRWQRWLPSGFICSAPAPGSSTSPRARAKRPPKTPASGSVAPPSS